MSGDSGARSISSEALIPTGRSTFNKRQKEQNRLQKRQEKAERKKQRSLEKKQSGPEIDWESAVGQPASEENDDTLQQPL